MSLAMSWARRATLHDEHKVSNFRTRESIQISEQQQPVKDKAMWHQNRLDIVNVVLGDVEQIETGRVLGLDVDETGEAIEVGHRGLTLGLRSHVFKKGMGVVSGAARV